MLRILTVGKWQRGNDREGFREDIQTIMIAMWEYEIK